MPDCCAPSPDRTGVVVCPGCGSVGKKVTRTTVESILIPETASAFTAPNPRYCSRRTCVVLYFAEDGTSATKDQARVRVGAKETEDPIPLCYCFGISRSDLIADVRRTGDSDAPARIQAEIRAGNCDCIRNNPSGNCCLGGVRTAVRAAREVPPFNSLL